MPTTTERTHSSYHPLDEAERQWRLTSELFTDAAKTTFALVALAALVATRNSTAGTSPVTFAEAESFAAYDAPDAANFASATAEEPFQAAADQPYVNPAQAFAESVGEQDAYAWASEHPANPFTAEDPTPFAMGHLVDRMYRAGDPMAPYVAMTAYFTLKPKPAESGPLVASPTTMEDGTTVFVTHDTDSRFPEAD